MLLEQIHQLSVHDVDELSEWVSSFLIAQQHILGYLVPYHGMIDLHKKGYNQGYLATIKMNNKYIHTEP